MSCFCCIDSMLWFYYGLYYKNDFENEKYSCDSVTQDLQTLSKTIVQWKKLEIGSGFTFTRNILIGNDSENKKVLYYKYLNCSNTPQSNEELAFRISEFFELHVVPKTICLNKLSEKHLFPYYLGSYHCCTVRKRIPENDLVIQEAVETKNNPSEIPEVVDLERQQKAILFTLLVGKGDARLDNSVYDREGRIWEIDNEYLGKKEPKSYLFKKYGNLKIDPKISDLISKRSLSNFKKELANFEKRHHLDHMLKETILYNFNNLKEKLKKEDITVKDLLELSA